MPNSTLPARSSFSFVLATFVGVTLGLHLLAGIAWALSALGVYGTPARAPWIGVLLLIVGAVIARAGLRMHSRGQTAEATKKEWYAGMLLGVGIATALPGIVLLISNRT